MGIHTNRNLKHFLCNTANHDNLVTILTGYRVNDGDVRSQCPKEKEILNLLTASRQALVPSSFTHDGPQRPVVKGIINHPIHTTVLLDL